MPTTSNASTPLTIASTPGPRRTSCRAAPRNTASSLMQRARIRPPCRYRASATLSETVRECRQRGRASRPCRSQVIKTKPTRADDHPSVHDRIDEAETRDGRDCKDPTRDHAHGRGGVRAQRKPITAPPGAAKRHQRREAEQLRRWCRKPLLHEEGRQPRDKAVHRNIHRDWQSMRRPACGRAYGMREQGGERRFRLLSSFRCERDPVATVPFDAAYLVLDRRDRRLGFFGASH